MQHSLPTSSTPLPQAAIPRGLVDMMSGDDDLFAMFETDTGNNCAVGFSFEADFDLNEHFEPTGRSERFPARSQQPRC